MESICEKDIDLLTDTKLSKTEELFIKNKDDNDMLSNIKKIVNNKNLDKKNIQRMVMMMEKLCANELQDLPINKIEKMLSNYYNLDNYIEKANILIHEYYLQKNESQDTYDNLFYYKILPLLCKMNINSISSSTCINFLCVFFYSDNDGDGEYINLIPHNEYILKNNIFIEWMRYNIDNFSNVDFELTVYNFPEVTCFGLHLKNKNFTIPEHLMFEKYIEKY